MCLAVGSRLLIAVNVIGGPVVTRFGGDQGWEVKSKCPSLATGLEGADSYDTSISRACGAPNDI